VLDRDARRARPGLDGTSEPASTSLDPFGGPTIGGVFVG
jgi:hypothetical protein